MPVRCFQPPELAAFVHLRSGTGAGAAAGAENIAQADGAPQWFGRPSPAFTPAGTGGAAGPDGGPLLNDWRQVTPEIQCPTATPCQVVIGVYNPATGERLPLLDPAGVPTGEEFVLGTVTIGPPPAPDQACALTGACE